MKNDELNTGAAEQAHYDAENWQPCESVGYLCKRVVLSVSRHIDEEMRQYGLTAMQWSPLILIDKGVNTVAEMARETLLDTSSMTRMLDRLEARQLVVRKRCAKDRRIVRLSLTPQGQELMQLIPAHLAQVLNHHLRGFSSEELATLKSLLHRFIENGLAMPETNEHDAEQPNKGSEHAPTHE